MKFIQVIFCPKQTPQNKSKKKKNNTDQ